MSKTILLLRPADAILLRYAADYARAAPCHTPLFSHSFTRFSCCYCCHITPPFSIFYDAAAFSRHAAAITHTPLPCRATARRCRRYERHCYATTIAREAMPLPRYMPHALAHIRHFTPLRRRMLLAFTPPRRAPYMPPATVLRLGDATAIASMPPCCRRAAASDTPPR